MKCTGLGSSLNFFAFDLQLCMVFFLFYSIKFKLELYVHKLQFTNSQFGVPSSTLVPLDNARTCVLHPRCTNVKEFKFKPNLQPIK
jgi:hypothetical protein